MKMVILGPLRNQLLKYSLRFFQKLKLNPPHSLSGLMLAVHPKIKKQENNLYSSNETIMKSFGVLTLALVFMIHIYMAMKYLLCV